MDLVSYDLVTPNDVDDANDAVMLLASMMGMTWKMRMMVTKIMNVVMSMVKRMKGDFSRLRKMRLTAKKTMTQTQ